jgi:RNA polymerase sigma factor (sigma-70 family)
MVRADLKQFMAIDSKPADPRATEASDKDATRARLDRLARRYYGPLVSFFRKRTRNTTEVHDLVQQVFLRLAQYRDADTIRDPEGYLFQTASNALKDHIRNAAVRARYLKEQVEKGAELGSGISPERVLLARENVALLSEALRQLPERTRDVLMLRCFEGLKHAEIARLQGISIRAVEKHMERALAHLSKAVGYGAEE